MKVKWELEGHHDPVLVVTPETTEERILLAAYIRDDSNVFHVSVDRLENGYINSIVIRAEDSK